MAKIIRTTLTAQQTQELDYLRATVEKQAALIDYLAVMADIDIPVEDTEGGEDDE